MTNYNKHQNESNLETMSKMPDNLACGEFEDIVKELWRITKDGGIKKAWEEKIKEMDIETTNFENFTADEYRDNLFRLGAVSHSSFVGKTVYYLKPQYGVHKVVQWDEDRAEFLLDLGGRRFWSNPFRIQNCC